LSFAKNKIEIDDCTPKNNTTTSLANIMDEIILTSISGVAFFET